MPPEKPCITVISAGDKAVGLGSYYDAGCSQGGVGCDYVQRNCRLCANKLELINKPYVECPACVPD